MKAKLVNERLGFTEDGDPVKDMGIGWDIKKEIEKRLKKGGNPNYDGNTITYREFMEDFLDRCANQNSSDIVLDLYRIIEALIEEGKTRVIDDTLDEDEHFMDLMTDMTMKLLSKLSVKKQMEWYEPIIDGQY